MPCKHKSKAR